MRPDDNGPPLRALAAMRTVQSLRRAEIFVTCMARLGALAL